tara:strand:+ start:4247 stop:5026 length:780 start_codon:yes stop_codon:yes gene_type:complete
MANVHDGISTHGIGLDERIALRRIIFHRQKSGFENAFSMSFDGTNDFLDCGDITILDGLTNLTVSMWVNFDTLPGTFNTARDLFRKGSNLFSSGFGIAIAGDGGSGNGPRLQVQVPGNFMHANHSSSPIPTGQWVHVGVTMSSSGFNMYMNGVRFSSEDQGSGVTIANNSDKLSIGSNLGSNAHDGLMDEIAVFNSTKTQSEIQNFYNSGVPTDLTEESGLIAYWRMEEGSGSTVADSSANSNTATLTNGPAFSTNVPS